MIRDEGNTNVDALLMDNIVSKEDVPNANTPCYIASKEDVPEHLLMRYNLH